MKALLLLVSAMLAPGPANSAVLTGSLSGPETVAIGELAQFQVDFTVDASSLGVIDIAEIQTVFSFGDGSNRILKINFLFANGSGRAFFDHIYQTAGTYDVLADLFLDLTIEPSQFRAFTFELPGSVVVTDPLAVIPLPFALSLMLGAIASFACLKASARRI